MKRFYESPSVEIEMFSILNQITTSLNEGGLNEGGEVIDPYSDSMNGREF